MSDSSKDAFPERLLASSVNGGGLFLVEQGCVEQISSVDTTGMANAPDGFVWARQTTGPAELRRVRLPRVERVVLTEQPLDLHDVLLSHDRLYVVATESNTLFEFNASTYAELRRWTLPGEPDSHHLNSVCVHGGRILVSRFGNFERHRGYKGATRAAGQVLDIETGEVLIEGLSQPHSLTSEHGLLWLCDSEAHRVLAFREFVLEKQLHVGGYARGLAFGASMLYVGVSRSRNEAAGSIMAAAIASYDLETLRPRERIEFAANEIYDLLVLHGEVADLRRAARQDTFHELDEMRHARNLAAMELHGQRAAYGELHAKLMHSQAETQRLEAVLGSAERLAKQTATRTAEEAVWTAMLHNSITGLQGRVDEMVRSRSWRWTHWLRAARRAAEASARPAVTKGIADKSGLESEGRAPRGLTPQDTGFDLAPVPVIPVRSSVPVLDMAFTEHDRPDVSIVVTAYGNFEQTRACLASIQRAGAQATFEVILVEDRSSDEDMGRFATVPGLRYVENPENLGYLRSVNRAASLARGTYLHLLNNDTEVTPGWLDALLSTFALFHECGLVGSKLVYPDGLLQEAGGIVWSDGNACNYGRGDDPSLARHRVVREVDYVSGASLILPTQRFIDLGGFDERYLPAYYEDTDLAFRIRDAGSKVYMQPASVVVHHEGLSHGTDITGGIKASQARNRDVFLDRWRDELARGQLAPGEHVFLARDRVQLGSIVLVVDRYPPQPDHDAGSRAIWQLMRVLFLRGFRMKFWMQESGSDPAYAAALRAHGIEALNEGQDEDFDTWMCANGIYIDHVILSRPMIAEQHLESVRRHSAATVTFYGHDIHYQRIARQAALEANMGLVAQAAHVKGVEHALWGQSDLVLYPSDEETAEVKAYLASTGGLGVARTVPLYAFESVPVLDEAAEPRLEERNILLFVGGYTHAPNTDGALWFTREVWPIVLARHPGLRLCLAGASPGPEVAALASDSVEVSGFLSEVALHAHYRRACVAIAPLRFGAGTKGKVIEAMWHGVPCVTTSVGRQGLSDALSLRVADDPSAMAGEICGLVEDPAEWWSASRDGQDYVRTRFSVQSVWNALEGLLGSRPAAVDVVARRARLDQGRCRS